MRLSEHLGSSHIANFADDQGNFRRWFMRDIFCLERNQFAGDTGGAHQGRKKRFPNTTNETPRLGTLHLKRADSLIYEDHRMVLYAGISDAGAQKIKLENPFRQRLLR